MGYPNTSHPEVDRIWNWGIVQRNLNRNTWNSREYACTQRWFTVYKLDQVLFSNKLYRLHFGEVLSPHRRYPVRLYPIHLASLEGDCMMVRMMLEEGADPDQTFQGLKTGTVYKMWQFCFVLSLIFVFLWGGLGGWEGAPKRSIKKSKGISLMMVFGRWICPFYYVKFQGDWLNRTLAAENPKTLLCHRIDGQDQCVRPRLWNMMVGDLFYLTYAL